MRVKRFASNITAFCVVAIPLVVLASCSRTGDPSAPPPVAGHVVAPAPARLAAAPGTDLTVVAAGDAVCGTGTAGGILCKHASVATLITSLNPTAVLLLGDNQYENATLADYNKYYNPTWGVFKNITLPSAGNHEYNTSGAKGYYDYFNGVGVQTGPAGDRSKGYYRVNAGGWHLIALNTNCSAIGGCKAGSPQELWLRADLAANAGSCVAAFGHHPRFSSGEHGNNAEMQPLWQALYDAGAELVLNGHDHEYERFAPQKPDGTLDAVNGVRQFVVGTGGKEHGDWSTIRANSDFRSNSAFGVLKLTLRTGSYDWEFMPVPGSTTVDAGSATCTTPAPPPPPPPAQTTLTIAAAADAHVLKDSPNTNYGSASTVLVDGSPVARTYLKFAVTGIGAKSIVSAKLRVYAVDPSDAGGKLHAVSNTTWTESGLKWSNAPAYNAAVVGTIGSVVSGSWYEVDVKSLITADGTVSLAFESTSTNGADYRSKEGGSSTAPRLVIVVQ